jgi:signal peptide peptidase SppA
VLLTLLAEHRDLPRAEFQTRRTGAVKSGQELEVDEAEIRDGIAIIPVGGPMGVNLGEFEKGAGAVDLNDVADEVDQMELDDDVSAIILDFDSPGGMFTGTFELAARVLACEKPIYAFTAGTMASAAYAVAAATDGIFATPSARVGSIGVYTVFQDLSQMAKQAGINVKVIASGPVKGYGQPGTALTAEQEMFLKENVMKMAKVFQDHIKATREVIAPEDMGGQFYFGEDAVQRGFVDGTLANIGELEDFLRLK